MIKYTQANLEEKGPVLAYGSSGIESVMGERHGMVAEAGSWLSYVYLHRGSREKTRRMAKVSAPKAQP
jgi:hypothetical protein